MTSITTDVYSAPQAELEEKIPNEQSGLFGFKGRLGVLGYMARALFVLFGMAVIGGIAYLAATKGAADFGVAISVAVILMIPLFWMSIAMYVKRLHDINMSAWWLLMSIIPIVGVLFGLFVGLKPGKPEGNRFGHAFESKGWEKPAGYVGIVVMVLFTVGSAISEIADIMGVASFVS